MQLKKPALLTVFVLLTCGCINDGKIDDHPGGEGGTYPVELDSPSSSTIIQPENPDLEDCSNISDALEKDSCIIGTAIKNRDPTLCNNLISNENDRTACKHIIGIELSDESLCDMPLAFEVDEDTLNPENEKRRYITYKDECNTVVALKNLDEGKCSEIIYPAYRPLCKAEVLNLSGNYENCGIDNDCWLYLAKFSENPKFCQRITNDGKKSDSCYLNFA